MSWKSLEDQLPDLTAFGAERLNGKVAYPATIRKDSAASVQLTALCARSAPTGAERLIRHVRIDIPRINRNHGRAVKYAEQKGAKIIEGYPNELQTDKLAGQKLNSYSGYMGIASVFRTAGFVKVADALSTPTHRLPFSHTIRQRPVPHIYAGRRAREVV
jgi:hypothetical protein